MNGSSIQITAHRVVEKAALKTPKHLELDGRLGDAFGVGTADGATETTATFSFARTDAPSAPQNFQCRLDSGSYSTCTSPPSKSVSAGPCPR